MYLHQVRNHFLLFFRSLPLAFTHTLNHLAMMWIIAWLASKWISTWYFLWFLCVWRAFRFAVHYATHTQAHTHTFNFVWGQSTMCIAVSVYFTNICAYCFWSEFLFNLILWFSFRKKIKSKPNDCRWVHIKVVITHSTMSTVIQNKWKEHKNCDLDYEIERWFKLHMIAYRFSYIKLPVARPNVVLKAIQREPNGLVFCFSRLFLFSRRIPKQIFNCRGKCGAFCLFLLLRLLFKWAISLIKCILKLSELIIPKIFCMNLIDQIMSLIELKKCDSVDSWTVACSSTHYMHYNFKFTWSFYLYAFLLLMHGNGQQ